MKTYKPAGTNQVPAHTVQHFEHKVGVRVIVETLPSHFLLAQDCWFRRGSFAAPLPPVVSVAEIVAAAIVDAARRYLVDFVLQESSSSSTIRDLPISLVRKLLAAGTRSIKRASGPSDQPGCHP